MKNKLEYLFQIESFQPMRMDIHQVDRMYVTLTNMNVNVSMRILTINRRPYLEIYSHNQDDLESTINFVKSHYKVSTLPKHTQDALLHYSGIEVRANF